jgi:2-keto-3-deoxy-L-rhamnonate aldolase RhmA
MARVPDISDSTILRFLDRGIMGITVPHITDGRKAKQLARAARDTLLGNRSFGSGRGGYYGNFPSGQAYMEHFNSNIIVIAQLEDIEVLENINDLLSVEGIDLFASGPQDIAQSMALPG